MNMSSTADRFMQVYADLLRMDITNEDPMRFSKRQAVMLAREELENAVGKAGRLLELASHIDSDSKKARSAIATATGKA